MSDRGLVVEIPHIPRFQSNEDPYEDIRGRKHWPPGRRGDTLTHLESVGPDPHKLRTWLLFWDELVVAEQLMTLRTPDENYLIDEGVLRVMRPGGYTDTASLNVYRSLEGIAPGAWSLATSDPLMTAGETEGRSVIVRLFDSIPLPPRETALADILQFKRENREALLDLREHLETVYLQILGSKDEAAALRLEVDKLNRAVKAVLGAQQRMGWRVRFAGIEARIKWEADVARVAALASAGFLAAGVPGALGGAALGFIPKIEVGAGVGMTGIGQSKTPFRYVALAQGGI